MPARLRSRLLISALVSVVVIGALVALVVGERLDLNQQQEQLLDLKDAVRQARELSLYVQYNAHDTNAYTLGHLEHREEFVEHAAAFRALVEELQQRGVDRQFHADSEELLQEVIALREQYDQASLALFDAADTNRISPSPANQAAEDAAWERADVLGDELDTASQTFAQYLDEDIAAVSATLAARNSQVLALVVGLGLVLAGMVLFVQRSAAAAVGRPLERLLETVQRFAAGDLSARSGLERQDEVGVLATAFDTMAERLSQQTSELQAESVASRAAQQRAEQAQHALAEQLATVEAQQTVIREMSVPILPLSHRSLVLPLIGALDTERLRLLQERALWALEQYAARYLILDITGVTIIDSQVAQGILRLVEAARLIGAEVILVGIRPEVAQSIVGLGLRLDSIVTRSTLQSGIEHTRRAGQG